MNPFDLIKSTPYVSQRVGLPLEELKYAAEKRTAMQERNMKDMDELSMFVNSIETNPLDKSGDVVRQATLDRLNKGLDEIASMDFGTASTKARNMVRALYKDVFSDRDLKQVMENKKRYDEFEKIKNELQTKGMLLDFTPKEFSSITTDEQGNKQYNDWQNYYQQRLPWEEGQMNIWKDVLKEELLQSGYSIPQADELLKKPFAEILQVKGIDQNQLQRKLDAAFDLYYQSPIGQQQANYYKHIGVGEDPQQIREALKQQFYDRGRLLEYENKSLDYQRVPEYVYTINQINDDNSAMRMGAGTSIEKTPRNIQDVEKTIDYNPSFLEKPDEAILQAKDNLIRDAFETPDFRSYMDKMVSQATNRDVNKTNWIPNLLANLGSMLMGGSYITKPMIKGMYDKKNPKVQLDTMLKELFPDEIKKATFDGKVDYPTLYKQLSAALPEIRKQKTPAIMTDPRAQGMDQKAAVRGLVGNSKSDSASSLKASAEMIERATRQEKAANFFIDAVNEAVKGYYKESTDASDNNNISFVPILFNSNTEGKALATEATTMLKRLGSASNMKVKHHLIIDDFDPSKFKYDLNSVSLDGITYVDGDIAFKANITGSYGKEDETTHEVLLTLDDDLALSEVMSKLPANVRNQFSTVFDGRGKEYVEGAEYYLGRSNPATGSRERIPYPKNMRIKRDPETGLYGIYTFDDQKNVTGVLPDFNNIYGQGTNVPLMVSREEIPVLIGLIEKMK